MTKKQLKWVIKEIVEQINKVNESFDLKPMTPKLGLSILDFSATSWEWRTILELIVKANDKFNLQIKDLDKWHYNDGRGLRTQEECNGLADALEYLIKDQPYNTPIRKTNFPPFIPNSEKIRKTYKTDVGTIQKFIKFLRTCGGFQIW